VIPDFHEDIHKVIRSNRVRFIQFFCCCCCERDGRRSVEECLFVVEGLRCVGRKRAETTMNVENFS
jgi:hypothetical protein